MHILYLITSADQGGAQRYVLELAQRFHGTVAAGIEQTWLQDQCARQGTPFIPISHLKRTLSPLQDLRAFLEIYRVILSQKPDIVHTNSEKMGIMGSIAAKLAGTKVVFTAHGMYYFTHPSRVIRWCYAAVEWCAGFFQDRIIAVSEHDRHNALRHHMSTPTHIITVHNAITVPAFFSRAEARAQLNLGPDAFVVGCIANYYHRKGLDILLTAIASIEAPKPLHCILIGDGPERQSLEDLATRLGILVRFTGQLPNANRLLMAFDIFALPSRYEGFPYVLLEALAAGLPIVATRVGGNGEALGTAGVIVPPEDPIALASALSTIIKSVDHRAIYSTQAHLQAQRFTPEHMLTQTAAVYSSLLDH
ncbi:MAG: glycosyltransferase family 4 protein [Candidatus Doudnabacteria bacterium]|nr:glycosyltransferase family 4 protein [Candidatus Doudnabacteria bacterium]